MSANFEQAQTLAREAWERALKMGGGDTKVKEKLKLLEEE